MSSTLRFYHEAFGMRRFATKGDDRRIPLVSPGLRDQITLSAEGVAGELGPSVGKFGESAGVDHFGFIAIPR